MDPQIIERYRKTQTMALRGATGPERETAHRILQDMEAKYPGIREAAAPKPAESPFPNPFGSFSGFSGSRKTWTWDEALQAAETVGEFAQRASAAYRKITTPSFQSLDHARVIARTSRREDAMLFGVSIPRDAFDAALAEVQLADGTVDAVGAEKVAAAIARKVHDAVLDAMGFEDED